MATAETFKLNEPSHYLWWFPGSPVKIHLALTVVRQLKDRILDSGASSSEEGLLFGGIRDGATEIVAFEPLASSNIPSMLAGLSPEKRALLVGYYRIENREVFQLSPQDHLLAADYFPKPFNVFLLVHPSKFGPPTATFFFHDRDGRMADFAFLEFPFDSSLLASEQHDRMQRSQQAQPLALVPAPSTAGPPVDAPPSDIPPVTAPTVTREKPKRNSIVKGFWWACLLVSVAGSGVLFNDTALRQRCLDIWKTISDSVAPRRTSPSAAPSTPRPSMSLRAVRQNGDLALTWDRNAPMIAAATSGTLSIQDGGSTRVLSFDGGQLRNGSLLYVPKADQILMQLTVTTPTGPFAESVTVILPNVGEPRTYPAPTAKAPQAPLAMLPSPSANAEPVEPLKAFVAPQPSKSKSPTLPILQDPPAANDRPSGPGLLAKAPATIPSSIERPPSPPPPASTPPPANSRPAPQLTTSVGATYEPAVAIAKTQPRYPEELRALLVKNIIVEVRVTIDAAGKVIQAEAIPQKNMSQLLLNSVVSASRLWKFKPALRNHEPVVSESILEFVFKP